MQRISPSPEDTFALGREIGELLKPGDVVLLYGGLGAGKTLLTKGILDALEYDVDEVTSPSFALVNLYKTTKFDVYHVDLWRVEEGYDPVTSVGLDEIVGSDVVTIIEWADRLAIESWCTTLSRSRSRVTAMSRERSVSVPPQSR